MEGGNGPSFNASNKYMVGKFLMFLHKVFRRLLCRNSNEWDTFIGRFKPYDFWLILLTVLLMAAAWSISGLTLSFLFLFGRLAAWSQEPKRTVYISVNSF